MHTDIRGVPVSCANPDAMASFEDALWQFQSFFGDPTEPLEEAHKHAPDFFLGHVFKAMAMLLSSEAQYRADAYASIEAAQALVASANDRERALLAAARQWYDGDWSGACRVLDEVLAEHPRDVLALQCAHLTDFLLGDALNLKQRVTRVLPAWDESVPGYSYVLGMHAFGLEECNEYARAEQTGCAALDLEPRDPWAVHAVTHVMEMQGDFDRGITWLESREQDWAPDNGFAFHNWWHLALFYLEKLDYAKALEIYDRKIYPEASDASMQLLDASALLWRLRLADVGLGDRFRDLADNWAKKAAVENGHYAFNDVHALMAYLCAGDDLQASAVLEALESAARPNLDSGGDNHLMSREVGLPVGMALTAFAEARYDEAIDGLQRVRHIAHRFGGSHAQRDVLTLTLVEAARRAGRPRLAMHVLNERLAARPGSPLANAWRDRSKTESRRFR